MQLSQSLNSIISSKASKAYSHSFIFYILSALGISLTVKAGIGVSCFNALMLSLSNIADLKLGTVVIIANGLFLLAYMTLTHFQLKWKYALQTLFVLLFGSFVNFFTYTLFGGLTVDQYTMRVFLLILGTLISASSVGMIVYYNVITFPLEGVCVALSERTKYSFMQYRYAIDVVSIAFSLLLTAIVAVPLNVREGTLISMLLFPYVAGQVNKVCQRVSVKQTT